MSRYEKKFHCYFAPFYVDKYQKLHILMGKKVLYSDQQGFFMSNAKQWILMGGNCGLFSNKNEIIDIYDVKYKKTLQRAINEFVEETGLDFISIEKIDPGKIFNYVSDVHPFEVFFFKVDDKDIENMKQINRKKAEVYFYEIDELKWVPFEIALYITDETNMAQNYSVGINDTLMYLKDLKERKNYWRLEDMNLRPLFRDYAKDRRRYIPKQYYYRVDELLDLYIKYGDELDRELIYFFKDFIQYIIQKKFSTSWFFEAFEYLKTQVDNNRINANISFIKNTGFNKQANPIIREMLYDSPGQIKIPTSFQSMVDSRNERRFKTGWTYSADKEENSMPKKRGRFEKY